MLPFRKGGFVETTTGFTKVENVDGKVVVTPMKREVKTETVKKELASPVKAELGFNPFKRELSPCEAIPDGGDAKRSRVNYEQLCRVLRNLNGKFVVENEELVSSKKALQAANGKLLGENTSLPQASPPKASARLKGLISAGVLCECCLAQNCPFKKWKRRSKSKVYIIEKWMPSQALPCEALACEGTSMATPEAPSSMAPSLHLHGTAHTAQ